MKPLTFSIKHATFVEENLKFVKQNRMPWSKSAIKPQLCNKHTCTKYTIKG